MKIQGPATGKIVASLSILSPFVRGLADSVPVLKKESARRDIPGVFVLAGEILGTARKEMPVGIDIPMKLVVFHLPLLIQNQ